MRRLARGLLQQPEAQNPWPFGGGLGGTIQGAAMFGPQQPAAAEQAGPVAWWRQGAYGATSSKPPAFSNKVLVIVCECPGRPLWAALSWQCHA